MAYEKKIPEHCLPGIFFLKNHLFVAVILLSSGTFFLVARATPRLPARLA